MAQQLLDIIRQRRSIRRYSSEVLDPLEVSTILEAGLRAPSSRGAHTTQFILVEDPEHLEALSYMRAEGAAFLREVPLAVIVLGSPMECESWMADASLAAGYMQLQCEALGLGSCWAAVYGQYTANGQDCSEYVRQLLHIPYQLEVLCALAIGHKAEELEPHKSDSLRWEQIHIGYYPSLEADSSAQGNGETPSTQA
ncbi:nitroreductase family protein [Porphyromonas sp. COT-239 OH1446]|uniref:nitroreductase family protein n=1 Tax=Porphyromonas sp. COT-239 OH1446 TaxID=1515613 RepID=UPI0006899584|nr:nitroreductase family protein [Porphyromonas sp. COT-239 OH1446]